MLSNTSDTIRRLLHLETFSTPIEFLSAMEVARQSGDIALTKVIEESHSMAALCKVGAPSPLVCESETRFARLYSVPETPRQQLIVVFTGWAMRPMMPLPIFMQALPRNTDLLILYDPLRNHYRRGIWDGNCTIRDLPHVMAGIIEIYCDIIALGASGGGLPALRFAKHARLRRGISFGGRLIDDTLRILRREIVPSAYDPLCACDEARTTEAILVYAADNVPDAHAAHCAAVAAASHLIALEGHSNHAVLWEITRMGHLSELLEMTFSASASALRNAIYAWNTFESTSINCPPTTGESRLGYNLI